VTTIAAGYATERQRPHHAPNVEPRGRERAHRRAGDAARGHPPLARDRVARPGDGHAPERINRMCEHGLELGMTAAEAETLRNASPAATWARSASPTRSLAAQRSPTRIAGRCADRDGRRQPSGATRGRGWPRRSRAPPRALGRRGHPAGWQRGDPAAGHLRGATSSTRCSPTALQGPVAGARARSCAADRPHFDPAVSSLPADRRRLRSRPAVAPGSPRSPRARRYASASSSSSQLG
jgi:hypothetical protein